MDMMRMTLIIVATACFCGCTQKSDNPLLDATDGQFKLTVVPYFECLASLEKAAKTFTSATKIKGEEEQNRRLCLDKTQELATGAGIADNVTFDHIQDPRVKERYLALNAEPTR